MIYKQLRLKLLSYLWKKAKFVSNITHLARFQNCPQTVIDIDNGNTDPDSSTL